MSVSQNFPTIDPSLRLNFQGARTLDPRITFERSSTGTYVDEDGLIKTAAVDQARFDYDPSTGESLGLLIEESRTNLVTYSEDFSQSVWIKQNGFSITSNTAIAPDGTLTADTASIVNLNAEYLYQNLGLPAGTYTLSCWIKSVNASSSFSISSYSGVDGSQSSSFTATNTWKRFSHTVTVSTPVTGFYPCIPSVSGEQFYIWGAQVEAGSFPTSYIPTSGSTATRVVDITKITGSNFSSWYNQNEGTIVYESALTHFPRNLAYRKLFSINAGTGSQDNVIHALAVESNTTVLSAIWNNSSPQYTQYSRGLSNYVANDLKFTIGYKDNDVISYMESAGFLDTVADNNVTIPKSMVRFDIGHVLDASHPAKQHVKQIRYYPTRLTNVQLQNLTK
jgi:hypothetical protein